MAYDKEFEKLLKVGGWKYRKANAAAAEFYAAWVAKCTEYDANIDFFEPLYAYMVGLGIKMKLIDSYFEKIRGGIERKLKEQHN